MSQHSARDQATDDPSPALGGNPKPARWNRINRLWPPLVTGGVALASMAVGANAVLSALPAASETVHVSEAARIVPAPLFGQEPQLPAPRPDHRSAVAHPSTAQAAPGPRVSPQPSANGEQARIDQTSNDQAQTQQPIAQQQAVPETQQPAAPEPDPVQQRVDAVAPSTDQLGTWINQALRVLVANGYSLSRMDPDDIRTIIQHESNGNPRAVNNADSNAAQGTPSKGLMQTIEPTFRTWALPGHRSIYDPVDNIIAGVRYSLATYGSLSNVPGVSGIRSGGSYQGY